MSPQAVKLAVVGVYFAALFVIAWYASKRISDISDFFIGGKKLGWWVVSFSALATGESGWLLLGLTGMGFAIGAHTFWILMGEMLGVCGAWIFLAQRFKVLTDADGSITVPDYLESRFQDAGHALRVAASAVLAVFITAYLSAQFTAVGKAFETFLGIRYEWGVAAGLGIILAYTVAGGFVAVAWTDLLQGLMMLAGLAALPVAALCKVGGFGALFGSLRALDPSLLSPWGADGPGVKSFLSAAGLVAIGLGYLGAPQIFVRFMSLRDRREIRQGSVVACLFTLVVDTGAILTGMCGRALYERLADQEAVLPALVNDLFPPLVVGFYIAVVLAAIMSTADSLLILVSSALVRDLYQKVLHPRASDRSLTNLGRAVTVGVCAAGLAFALSKTRLVFWFVLFGWAGITSVFCPVIVLSLFWKGLTRDGALAGMLTGAAVTVLWNTVPLRFWFALLPGLELLLDSWGFVDASTLSGVLYEILPATAAATAAAVLVSRLGRPPSGAEAVLARARREAVDLWS